MRTASNIQTVILCGGAGTRLWPLSRAKYPKQFMRLSNGSTLFAETLLRAGVVGGDIEPLVVSNDEYRFYADEILKKEGKEALVILEPSAKNTAPAIALAAFATQENTPNALMLVMPSDHRFLAPDDFYDAVKKAVPAVEAGNLVTFGINPTSPETGFGYIKQGSQIDDGVYKVERFLEKPQKAKAEAMLSEGGHYWNSGIFFFKASVFLGELKKIASDIYTSVEKSWKNRTNDLDFVRPGDDFSLSPSDSIDYAIMEHTDRAAVVPMNGGWSDLGSWGAFYDVSDKDNHGNVCIGGVLTDNTQNCYLRSSGRLLATVGVSNLAIVETKDAVLIADRNKTQDVKRIVDQLKLQQRNELESHPFVYRPWGNYETLVLSDRFQVKRIIVKPGEQNSLQMHYHRAEHWTVVSGTAEVTIGEKKMLVAENESVYIPLGTKHRIRNPGTIPLVFIEVQTGSYLGEDDIVRFEDNYGRTDATGDEVEA
ncbi:MAG: mannose-1-phosphate guanylyltransferase/mannose-6-phosphate isomerase [Oxalobacter sp.]